jgi:filamentous hemagglutinin
MNCRKKVSDDLSVRTYPARPGVKKDGLISNVPDGSTFVPNPSITKPYKRPTNAGPTAAQKRAVQGQPCVECGDITPKQVADHIDPLSVEFWRTGGNDIEKQTQPEAVQPHCRIHSDQQGGQLSDFSRKMREKKGL